MGSLNEVTLLGHLGKDPEMKTANSGTVIANMTLATTERRPDGSGGYQDHTEWHKCVAFGKTAEICNQFLKKGHLTLFKGRLQTRQYEKDGQKHYMTEVFVQSVQLLYQKERAEAKRDEAPARSYQSTTTGGGPDDDIPF